MNVTKGAVVAVNAKVFSAAFFNITFFKNVNISQITAAQIQPNPFWFWVKYCTYKLGIDSPVCMCIVYTFSRDVHKNLKCT